MRLHPKLYSHLKSKAVRTALLKIKMYMSCYDIFIGSLFYKRHSSSGPVLSRFRSKWPGLGYDFLFSYYLEHNSLLFEDFTGKYCINVTVDNYLIA